MTLELGPKSRSKAARLDKYEWAREVGKNDNEHGPRHFFCPKLNGIGELAPAATGTCSKSPIVAHSKPTAFSTKNHAGFPFLVLCGSCAVPRSNAMSKVEFPCLEGLILGMERGERVEIARPRHCPSLTTSRLSKLADLLTTYTLPH